MLQNSSVRQKAAQILDKLKTELNNTPTYYITHVIYIALAPFCLSSPMLGNPCQSSTKGNICWKHVIYRDYTLMNEEKSGIGSLQIRHYSSYHENNYCC